MKSSSRAEVLDRYRSRLRWGEHVPANMAKVSMELSIRHFGGNCSWPKFTWGLSFGSMSIVEITRYETALNCETVARTLPLSFLSRCDQVSPRHWCGISRLKSSISMRVSCSAKCLTDMLGKRYVERRCELGVPRKAGDKHSPLKWSVISWYGDIIGSFQVIGGTLEYLSKRSVKRFSAFMWSFELGNRLEVKASSCWRFSSSQSSGYPSNQTCSTDVKVFLYASVLLRFSNLSSNSARTFSAFVNVLKVAKAETKEVEHNSIL